MNDADGQRRSANVDIYTHIPHTRQNLRSYKFMEVRATRNISAGEELYFNYGEKHPMFEGEHGREGSGNSTSEESDYSEEEHEASESESDNPSGDEDEPEDGE